MSEPTGKTPCARCVVDTCGRSSCVHECEYGTGWCWTWILAGLGLLEGILFDRSKVKMEVVIVGYIRKPSRELIEQGLVEGTLISHKNRKYLSSVEEATEALAELPSGTELRVKKPGMDWELVILK